MKRPVGFLLGLLVLSGLAAAPGPPTLAPARADEMRRLQKAARESHYAYDQVAWLSDHIGPRLSGSVQAQAAVTYVARELSKLGLSVKLEKCMVPHWVRGEEQAEVVAWPGQTPGTHQKIVLCALGGSVATPPEGITAPVVVVSDYAALDRLPADAVRGHIVLFNHAFDEALSRRGEGLAAYEEAVEYRWSGAVAAARHGAVACLVRSAGSGPYRMPHTGSMGYEDDAPKIPAAAVTHEDADLLHTLCQSGPVQVHLLLTPQTLPDVESANVVADLPGTTRKDEIVLVSGHLDSWDLGTGAIDDGAGVALAMETAHLVTSLHLTGSRTLRIVAWMNEENGTRGAKAYAAAHQADHHYAAIESDLGADATSGFMAHVDAAHMDTLEPLRTIVAEAGAPVLQPSFEGDGADISPLDKLGVPTFGNLQDVQRYFDYHHTAADTLDKIDPAALQQNAAVMASFAWGLTNLEAALK